jgi:hypothetical protein
VIFRHPDLVILIFFTLAAIALFLLAFIARKVNRMLASVTALTSALAELQTSFAALEQRVATPAPPAISPEDEAAITSATATMATLKSQVDALAPVPAAN